MGTLSNLEPKEVFRFFEELCNIPHGSGNLEQISSYLVNFANDRGLEHRLDKAKNVIIVKEATFGYEKEPAIIIQGHMDMVAVKKAGADIDMKHEPLKLKVDGDFICAEDTSLGGDDGIAVAFALAVLDSEEIAHPRVEVVITSDEEIGLLGAEALDLSDLQAKRLINIDSEEEGLLWTSCAGGSRLDNRFEVKAEGKAGEIHEILLTGLLGGHSGIEIHKERGNAICLIGRLLYKLSQKMTISLAEISGGEKSNAIAKTARAVVVLRPEDKALFEKEVNAFVSVIRHELAGREPEVTVNRNCMGTGEKRVLAEDDFKKILTFLMVFPNGIQTMSAAIKGLVETSVNVGEMDLKDGVFSAGCAVRSSVGTGKSHLTDRIIALCTGLGGNTSVGSDYPAWEYKQESPLRDKLLTIYREMYGKDMVTQAVHAGLECGILSEKIEGLDCVSIGPDMYDVHTTDEKLRISSTKRVWEYLVEILKKKDR